MSYKNESQALDAEILGVIAAWHERGDTLADAAFNELALKLFVYQLRYNAPYARYCRALGVTSAPGAWDEIPAVPAAAFKEAALTTFDPTTAALRFETSGTTSGVGGLHYMETPALYDAALLAGFDRFVLSDGARLRYFNLVPNAVERASSSLGYMIARVAGLRGDDQTGWYLRGDELLFDAFARDLATAIEERQPVCIAATAFALVNVLDAVNERALRFALPQGSRIMETGGFKGRTRAVDRDQLYGAVCDGFGVPDAGIIAEYGMTELTSQYYDAAPPARYKSGPPWLRTRVVGPDRRTLPPGTAGALLHVDLANRSSSIAVQTEDVGMQTDDGLVLLGRAVDAPPRGCSLDAEELQARSALTPTGWASSVK
jgi:Acyl-protein synthetase, LuxE